MSYEVEDVCARMAKLHGVPADIHPNDAIFRFVYNHPGFQSKEAAVRYYFDDAAKSAAKVKTAIDRWCEKREQRMSVLEFAAGYGAVTRHFSQIVGPHYFCSSDIHPDANEFIAKQFGVQTLASNVVPERLSLPVKFDVIFVLSFFSHMPRATWLRWLQKLYSCINIGGILLFTTHGRESLKHFPQAKLDASGFWFEQSSEQKDLDSADYGQTITAKDFVDSQIATLSSVEYLTYERAGWWEHQDLYIIRKR